MVKYIEQKGVNMDLNLVKYQITPRVVKTNQEQTISVKGVDKSSRFFDDVDYTVTIIRTDGW